MYYWQTLRKFANTTFMPRKFANMRFLSWKFANMCFLSQNFAIARSTKGFVGLFAVHKGCQLLPPATSRITTAFLLLLESSYLINAMLRWKTTYSGTPFLYFYFRRWVLSYFTSAIVIWMIVRSLYWHCWNKYMQARHKNGSLGGVNVKMGK